MMQRILAGDVMSFDLAAEIDAARIAHPAPETGRTARTLVKDGPLRVTLIVLEAGGVIAEHAADGPITIQPVSGTVRILIAGDEHVLRAGQLLTAVAGVRHAVASDDGAAFLLTVVLAPRAA